MVHVVSIGTGGLIPKTVTPPVPLMHWVLPISYSWSGPGAPKSPNTPTQPKLPK